MPGRNETIDTERAYILWHSPLQTKTYELKDFSIIGRDGECQISFEDPFISQRHARIVKKGEKYIIQDLRSSNGTRVNGTLIVEAELKDKDRITIGKQDLIFSLIFEDKESLLTLSSKNEKWNECLKRLPAMAQSDFPILITGPSGTGKEVLAKLIHRYSTRHFGPFVSVNCSALSENLVESELFGHVKGSFTGADNHRKGAFESARNGTLFLDEIGDLPMSLQPKLLRALENFEIKPVGSDSSIKTDVRIVAATHNTLKNKVAKGQFREDLFYRLNVVNLSPPALKNRMEDFDSLIYYFAKMYKVRFSFSAINHLKDYEWPGNVRELKNLVARASAMYGKDLIQECNLESLIERLPTTSSDFQETTSLKNNLNIKEMEKTLICQALIKNRGNQRKAAEALGLPKSTLNDRIRNYKINIDQLLDV
ncbi:MAG: sigma 54-interacting transcriptional regulator [Bdellovibrionales bacterium]|nr:sigma 54-interacting transcriptional regulator [Bdellovibrionales bacterium]